MPFLYLPVTNFIFYYFKIKQNFLPSYKKVFQFVYFILMSQLLK